MGEGKGVVMLFLSFLREPSQPHSLTHSAEQYITNHSSPYALQSPKYHFAQWKDLLKNPKWTELMIYLQWILDDGNGKKPKNTIIRNQGKIPRLVALRFLRQRNGGRLFSGVRKHRKQAGPTLAGRVILTLWSKKKTRKRVGPGMGR